VKPISRRTFLAGTSLLPLASMVPRQLMQQVYAQTSAFRVLTPHEVAVVDAATARLIPSPTDDPAEAGHPGAREANVVRYIDTMLGALGTSPPRVFAGGPYSKRAGGTRNDLARFLPLDEVERTAWKTRLSSLQQQYTAGVAALDGAAGGDFTTAAPMRQDAILSEDTGGFASLMMQHAIEGMYSNPEYGGNAGLVGWKDIAFPGDSQPHGYTAEQVTQSDGPDELDLSPVVKAALALITATAPPQD
jgi:hypothetical protein